MTQTIEQLQAKVAELEEENELLKGRKNVELAANTDNAKSKQQRELAGPMEMGQLLAGSTHKTSGDLEVERTKPVTWIHKGGGFISDSRGKFIGCFSGDFRYRDRIICAVNSESETSNQLAAEQLNNKLLRKALEAVIKVHGYESGIPVEAISTQASTEALDKYVAEKVKEIIESHAPEGRNVTNAQHVEMRHKFVEQIATLTRQRDLAVEALEDVRKELQQSNDRLYEEREIWDRVMGDGVKKLERLELELDDCLYVLESLWDKTCNKEVTEKWAGILIRNKRGIGASSAEDSSEQTTA